MVVPVPICWIAPVPLIAPSMMSVFERLKARVALSVTALAVALGLFIIGPFALLVTFGVVLVAAAAVIALAGAILATPFLLVRHLRQRLAKRRVSVVSAPMATVVAARAAR